MLTAVEATIQPIVFVIQVTSIETNLGLANLLWTMASGNFLSSRVSLFLSAGLSIAWRNLP